MTKIKVRQSFVHRSTKYLGPSTVAEVKSMRDIWVEIMYEIPKSTDTKYKIWSFLHQVNSDSMCQCKIDFLSNK